MVGWILHDTVDLGVDDRVVVVLVVVFNGVVERVVMERVGGFYMVSIFANNTNSKNKLKKVTKVKQSFIYIFIHI